MSRVFRRRAGSNESKDKAKGHDGSAVDCATGDPVHELQSFDEHLTVLKQRIGPLQDSLLKYMKDSQDKDDTIAMQVKKIQALTDRAARNELEIKELQGLVRQKDLEMEACQLQMKSSAEQLAAEIENLKENISAVSEERDKETVEKCKLAEELKKLQKQMSHLHEDLHASVLHNGRLNQQLKDAQSAEKANAYLLSRVSPLEEEVKDKELKRKEAEENYQMQVDISGTLFNEKSELEKKNAQLSMELAQANKAILAVASERDKLRSAEERLQYQLQEREKKISELEHDTRALREHNMKLSGSLESTKVGFDRRMKDVAALALTPVSPAGPMEGVGQHTRNNFRPCHKAHDLERAASGDLSIVDSGVWDETLSSTSPPRSPPIIIPQVPADNLPAVSTAILAPYAGRIAPKWYEVGHALGVGTDADSLLHTEQSTERKCLLCLKAWIDNGPAVECSWEKLIRVLCTFQLNLVAFDIQDELHKQAM